MDASGNIGTDLQAVDRWLTQGVVVEGSDEGLDGKYIVLTLYLQGTDESMSFLLHPDTTDRIATDLFRQKSLLLWPDGLDGGPSDDDSANP